MRILSPGDSGPVLQAGTRSIEREPAPAEALGVPPGVDVDLDVVGVRRATLRRAAAARAGGGRMGLDVDVDVGV